ncbi:MAG TPA: selenide, water dikinase SelD [Sphingobacteriaceae bacterium]
MDKDNIRLTQYSHGAGCGCKISPAILDKILHTSQPLAPQAQLLVGNDTRDDAAVYDLGNGTALISTTDFFMPIVDDPFDFGRIASANAISDVYAMGGKPALAIAILGWPIDKLAPEVAQKVLEGARSVCAEAGIALAGGHSIDCPEPVFGLAVNGIIQTEHLKKNSTATAGCRLYLTKALGVGILTTAQKKGLLKDEHAHIAPQSMSALNKIGEVLGKLDYVKAMTDVTGFGLLGHLSEMCAGSGLQAVIDFDKVPRINVLEEYLSQGSVPGGTHRNWASYGKKVSSQGSQNLDAKTTVLADPQTSGGLLIAVTPEHAKAFETVLRENNIPETNIISFGFLEPATSETLIRII